MLNTSPKLKHLAIVSALAATAWMGTAIAQTGANSAQTDTMENFLTNHPQAAKDLHNNPALINDPKWLSQHPNVQSWMNSHPNLKAEAATNPGAVVNRTEREALNRDRKALTGTDQFLAKHPQMAKDLNENPRLVNDPAYLAKHPELETYLSKNPGVKSEWQKHPEAFARAARANEEYNRTGKVPPVAHTKPVAKQ